MSNKTILKNNHHQIRELYVDFREATYLTRSLKAQKLMSQLDMLAATDEGIAIIYEMIGDLSEAGIFKDTTWSDPAKLVPALVNGTIKSGHPNSTIEVLSDLRVLAIANAEITNSTITAEEAESFIQDVVVSNLEFVFNDTVEETRIVMNEHEMKKAHALFKYLLEHTKLEDIKQKLGEEILMLCRQRPVSTTKQRKLIAFIRDKIKLNTRNTVDMQMLKFQNSIYQPTKNTAGRNLESYGEFLITLDNKALAGEVKNMGKSMQEFGLVSRFHAVLLRFIVEHKHHNLVPACLGLSESGAAKWKKHDSFVSDLISRIIVPYNEQCIYGLANILELDVFSREDIRSSISNLYSIRINTAVEERIMKTTPVPAEKVSPRQYLIGSLIRILGQPLGVRQGNNPTCQSARGISMWSQFSPARLINMLQTAAVHNDLSFRFEGREIKSSETGKGLVQTLDYNLDAVSVTLVPIIDKIYNEMMIRASGRGEDPHKWVNPALYGQWIQVGFASAYDYLSNAIVDFDGFVRIFYAMCHPEYNGGYRLVYPNPVGIYITSSRGKWLGFHAVSLLRVEKDPQEQYRAYFLNPNNEGQQDWGQNIKPSVYGCGERYGESSLPLHEFAARVYAFHYNSLESPGNIGNVPVAEIKKVKTLAKNSWGKSYTWLEIKKKW